MKTLFDDAERQDILRRIGSLRPESERRWGKMNAAQMLAHCAIAMEVATGDTPRPHALIGRLLGPFFKGKLLGPEPFSKDSPTDPTFVVTDARDFAKERERLTAVVTRFCDAGPSAAGGRVHSFLGRLRGEEWGIMMRKHLDHHLMQFGA